MKRFKRTAFTKALFYILPSSDMRIKYLKKHHVFAEFGEKCFYQCRTIPVEPNLVKIHNNVVIAANVHIIPHDIIHMVFNNADISRSGEYGIHMGCIEIMDNCFIGSNSVIMEGCRIGPNAIVAAGAIVTKDVPEGAIVGGNPAHVIGSFSDLAEKRKPDIGVSKRKLDREQALWDLFNKKHEAVL